MKNEDEKEFGSRNLLSIRTSEIDSSRGLVGKVVWYVNDKLIPTVDEHFLIYVVSEFFDAFSKRTLYRPREGFVKFDYTTEFRDGLDLSYSSDTETCCIRVVGCSNKNDGFIAEVSMPVAFFREVALELKEFSDDLIGKGIEFRRSRGQE